MLTEAFKLLERGVVALEVIASVYSGNGATPATTPATTSAAKPPTIAEKAKVVIANTGCTSNAAKKALKACDGNVDAAIASMEAAEPKETAGAAKAEATKSAVDKTKTGKPTADAGEVAPTADAGEVAPTAAEIEDAQVFKKELLALGRGNDNYVVRLKAILGEYTAETVPVEERDRIRAEAEAEFDEEAI